MPNTAARPQEPQLSTAHGQFAAIVMVNPGWQDSSPTGELPRSAIEAVGMFDSEREAWKAAKAAAQSNRDSIGFYVEEAREVRHHERT